MKINDKVDVLRRIVCIFGMKKGKDIESGQDLAKSPCSSKLDPGGTACRRVF
jgi:hypothetical protein